MTATVRLAGSARREVSPAANTTVRPLIGTELAAPAAVTLHLRQDPRTDGLAVRLARQHLSTGPRRRHIGAAELTTLHCGRGIGEQLGDGRRAARPSS
jgi:hypothetical protein